MCEWYLIVPDSFVSVSMATDTNRLQVLAHLVAGQRCVRLAGQHFRLLFCFDDACLGCKQLYQRRIVRKRAPTSSAEACQFPHCRAMASQDVRVLWSRQTKLDELDIKLATRFQGTIRKKSRPNSCEEE